MASYTYRYWRMSITANRGSLTAVELSEFALVNGTARLTGMTISATNSATAVGEEPAKAGDDTTATKWTNTNLTPCTLVYDFGAPVTADRYRWATGDVFPQRDPITWTVDGSDNGSTWTTLDTRTTFTGTTDRLTFLPDFWFAPPPTTVLEGSAHTLALAVEVAWGADLTDTGGSSWVWTELTPDVLVNDGEQVSYSHGRQDEASLAQPAECRLRLDNRSGAYSLGPQSANWPNVRRGTPLRLRVAGDVSEVVWSGFVDSWQPDWDASGRYAVVNITASGPLRRLLQGRPPVLSSVRRAMRDRIGVDLIEYWPMEDAKDASYCSSDIPGHAPLLPIDPVTEGLPKFAGAAPFACSAPIVGLDFTGMEAAVSPYAHTGQLQLRLLCEFPKNGMNGPHILAQITMTDRSATLVEGWYLFYDVGGTLKLGGYGVEGLTIAETSAYAFDVDGLRLRVGFYLKNNGANLDWQISTYAPGAPNGLFASGTFAGINLGRAESVGLNTSFSTAGDPVVGHLTLQTAATDIFTDKRQLDAYVGEGAVDRIERLCEEYDVPITIIGTGTSGPAMGPQSVAALPELLRECEIADQGVLYDGQGDSPGLTYCAHAEMINDPEVQFNVGNGRVRSVDVVDDDQALRNQVTVSRTGGGTITVTDTDGPLGTATVGLYDDSATVNLESDDQLSDHAGWLVHTGTVEGYRYPRVVMDLRDLSASQVAFLLEWLRSGRRFDLLNLDSYRAQLPSGNVSLTAHGWTASLDKHRWTYEINAGPYAPYRVIVLDDAEYGLQADTAASTLASSASAGATSLSVTTSSGPLWSTDAADYPTTVEVGDLPVIVSAVSGASSPQTFTCTAVSAARAAGVAVQLPRAAPVIDIDDDSGD